MKLMPALTTNPGSPSQSSYYKLPNYNYNHNYKLPKNIASILVGNLTWQWVQSFYTCMRTASVLIYMLGTAYVSFSSPIARAFIVTETGQKQ